MEFRRRIAGKRPERVSSPCEAASVENPLENDVEAAPQDEIGHAEPGEGLITSPNQHQFELHSSGIIRSLEREREREYHAVEGSVEEEEYEVERMHATHQLRKERN